ncbi:MAG TPA: TatD family hydrolase [Actinomycetota bacterium]|nr:TatD family hydrolase [Actinomycetota bacterium]
MIDSHAHLDMLGDADAAMARARDAGVEAVVAIGVDMTSSRWAAAYAAGHDDVWATVGSHPHDAKDWSVEFADLVRELAAQPRVVGISEAGLDYYYDNSPRDRQQQVFREHIRLAHEAGKTLVIHTRDAWDDTFAILTDEGVPERLVFHCWTGGPAEAERAVEIGAVLSISGIVTFNNAQPIRDAVAITPVERLIVETDSPFLTPVPHRGTKNEPAYVTHVAEAIAQIKGMTMEEFEAATVANTRRVFATD